MSKQRPNPTKIANELRGASAFFRPAEADPSTTDPSVDPVVTQSPSQSTDRSINRQDDRSTNQPETSPPTPPSDTAVPENRPDERARIVSRPKGFYITEGIDQHLDDAVRYLQETHRLRKVDRSTLLNALLTDDALWSPAALDRLVDRVVDQLTNRLTGRL